ncbi:MAG: organic solvent tolerance protein OstA [Pirellulales bacterium]
MHLHDAITIKADAANRWSDGKYEIWALKGNCSIQQGQSFARSQEAVLWIELGRYGEQTSRFTAYMEGDVTLDATRDGTVSKLENASWMGAYESLEPLRIVTPSPGGEPARPPEIFQRGVARRDPALFGQIRRTQYTQFQSGGIIEPSTPGTRRLRVFPRSDVPVQAKWFPNEARNEWVAVIDSGINLIIDGDPELGSVDISADRIVIWTQGDQEPDLSGQTTQRSDTPLEIYMEGNLVFRQGERVIYAERMYYDVPRQTGTILDSEILTPIPSYQGLLRIKAQVLQQTGKNFFQARDALVTSSRFGKPSYRLQANDLVFTDNPQPVVDRFSGLPLVDPESGEPLEKHNRLVTSRNNFIYMGDVPVFYWPVLKTNLENPTYYIRRAQFRQDQIMGTQFLVDFDAYQILNIDPVEGTDWTFNLDLLSKRGVAPGTTFKYSRQDFFGLVDGPTAGTIDLWGLYDSGLDTLGADRINLAPEQRERYRVLGQHRQKLPGDFQITAELGVLSDRNVLEQYYENEWDNFKDQTTGLELKKTIDNMSFDVVGDVRLNRYFAETQGVRGDHFWLGKSLLGDWVTWYEHTLVGYQQLAVADPPAAGSPEVAQTTPLLWESEQAGERLLTRHEFDIPLQAGPVKIVPYGLGELAHWGADINGNGLERLYGQAGVRTSIPFWAVNPAIESELFNVHGVAHKINLEAEYLFAEATEDVTQLPLYDPLDDNSTEHFRRRLNQSAFFLPQGTQPGAVPGLQQFDERFYAIRSGEGSWVTSPTPEVVEDLQAVKLGLRQRWQTKRGAPGERRIIDWIVFDTQATLFPNRNRDNAGEYVGLLQYNFRWHVGDRTTLVSDGIFDMFDMGQQVVSIGAFLNRVPRTSIYVGLRSYSGVFDTKLFVASATYRLSPKWLATASTTVSITGQAVMGQYLALTRIGESFLVSGTFTSDVSKNNTTAMLNIEPRFLKFTGGGSGSVAGAFVPPAGIYGLE